MSRHSKQPLPRLLPDVAGIRKEPYGSPTQPLQERKRITVACEACRSRKTKCNGVRPRCYKCSVYKTPCTYSETQERAVKRKYTELVRQRSAHEELFDLLKTMPEHDSSEVLRRIRSGIDPESIVNQIKDGNLLIQLSLGPEVRRRYELPFIFELPHHLRVANNPYLASPLYQAGPISSNTYSGASNGAKRAQKSGNSHDRHSQENRRPYADVANSDNMIYMVPYHTAQMIEALLEQITAPSWTQVISDNQLLRRLICSYFLYPHPCGPFIHKDLFLNDMATCKTRFCSPLLVNAMLAIASQTCNEIPNRSKVWLPESLSYKFMAEARRLWDLELARKNSITTIQAALLLSYGTAINGMDQVSVIYLIQAVKMSRDLELFGPKIHGTSGKMRKARTFTAWAVFSYQAMFNYYYFRAPLLEQPPEVPLPDPVLHRQWYGEIWVQYPACRTLVPLGLAHKLHEEAELHTIMNEIGFLTFDRQSSSKLSFDKLDEIVRKLNSWMKLLPEPLQPANVVFPYHICLHIQYLQLVVAIMKLILSSNIEDLSTLSTFKMGTISVKDLSEANMMLETLICIYYTRHSFELYDPWISFTLTIIGNAAVEKLATESSDTSTLRIYRSLLVLSAHGLKTQGLYYPQAALLSAQLHGAIDPGDLQMVRTYVTAVEKEEENMDLVAQHSKSQWPLPIIGLDEDPEKVRLGNLVQAIGEVEIQPSDVSSQEGTPSPG